MNFAHRSIRAYVISAGDIFLATLMLVGTTCAVLLWQYADREVDRLSAQLALHQSQQQSAAKAAMPKVPIAIPPLTATSVNAAIRQLNIPWRDMFDAVESATPQTIDVVSLEPDAAAQQLMITAEASAYQHMLAYVGRLKQEPLVIGAMLVKHEPAPSGAPNATRFQVLIRWRAMEGRRP